MTTNPRILPDSAYVNGAALLVPGGTPDTWWATLDAAQVDLLDGDAGGTWAPASSIEIGGAGMWAAGPWYLSPPAITVMVPISAGNDALTHGDSDFITLAANHGMSSRFLLTEAAQARDSSGCPTLQTYTAPGGGQTGGIMGPTAAMLPSVLTLGISNTPVSGWPYRPGGRWVAPLRVHHGATLSNVTFFFVISSTHTGQPDVLPQFRVHKVDLFGNLTPLNSTTPNGSGFFELPWPGSLATYKSTTAYAYQCDAGTVIDTTKYSYYVEVIDESGTNATGFNDYLGAEAYVIDIADMRPQ
jgi:hypothetical protein